MHFNDARPAMLAGPFMYAGYDFMRHQQHDVCALLKPNSATKPQSYILLGVAGAKGFGVAIQEEWYI